MKKEVLQKSDLRFTNDFPGLKGVNMFARNYPIEPFLVFTEFLMDKPVFGPHPHAGVSVLTYMLPDSNGSFVNRDSEGDFSIIEPGGVHIMQAGRGMMHDEFPKEPNTVTHGFQIWINHADKDRMVQPKSMHADANELPEVLTKDYKVRIVHGAIAGKAPPYKMVTPVTLFHIFLKPRKKIVLDAGEMAFVYGLSGNGSIDHYSLKPQSLVNFSKNGDQVEIMARSSGFEFMFGSGKPHREPIAYGGSFVMTTNEQLLKAQQRFSKGEMGNLEPYKIQ